jgi:putative transposase
MARLPRLVVPGYPHHIIHRGHNRQTLFESEDDYRFFLELLATNAQKFALAVHAYVLMPNHIHLLATPQDETAIAKVMQSVGLNYTMRFNWRRERTGSVWEGRYKMTVVDTDRYCLTCQAYIELNPVRAGMVARPEDALWSSYRNHAGLHAETWLTPHPTYWALGNTPFAREAAYRAMVEAGIPESDVTQLTESALKGWPTGNAHFMGKLKDQSARPIAKSRPGRPRKLGSDPNKTVTKV